jgi:hypothetical protein
MKMVEIVSPTLDEYLARVRQLSEKYLHDPDSWFQLTITDIPESELDDRDEFSFIKMALWDKLIERIARLEADRDEFKKDFLESDALRAELEDELTALRLKFAHLFGRSPDGMKKLEAENAALKAREDALVKALRDILSRKDMCFSKARTILAQIDAEKGGAK